jgi:single-strand DNA-binding protein
MKVTGKVKKILEVEKIQGKNGELRKGGLVIETDDKYPQLICCTSLNDEMVSRINDTPVGLQVECSVNLRGREWKGRYYTEVQVWKIEKLDSSSDDSGVLPADDDLPF